MPPHTLIQLERVLGPLERAPQPAGGASPVPTWRVDAAGQRFAVKVFPTQSESAHGQAELLAYLHAQGFPVARAQTLETLEHTFLCVNWLEGETVAEALRAKPDQAHALGERCGRLHAELHRLPVPPEALERVPRLEGFPEVSGGRLHLLHLDFHPLNVLIGPGGLWLLDWENVRLGEPRADVARTLSVLSVDPTVVRLPRAVRGALNRFRRGYLMGYSALEPLAGLRPFLAAAGRFMVADLAGRCTPLELRPVQRWTAWWAAHG